jgi:alpha-tubulin suppressor-like RCC1 family protein
MHACALIADGSVWCWGSNVYGQIGNGNISAAVKSLIPEKVVGIEDAIAISAGNLHACAALSGGAVKCWGSNANRQLGSIAPANSSGTPITVAGLPGVTAVACGGYFSCGLSAGAVYCWGSNNTGRLGSGKTFNELGSTATPVAVAGVTTAVSLAAGPINGCVALASGSVQCWGFNSDGQTGTLPPFAQDVPSPSTVAGITGPIALTIGEYHVCGLLPAGTIKCWGSNTQGQLGDGHLTSRSATPLDVVGISGAMAVAAGLLDTCAIGADGRARCWGFGGLGDGGTASSSSNTPVVVMGLSDARKLSANEATGCAVRADGSVACWGGNYYGTLGDGSNANYGASAVFVSASW